MRALLLGAWFSDDVLLTWGECGNATAITLRRLGRISLACWPECPKQPAT